MMVNGWKLISIIWGIYLRLCTITVCMVFIKICKYFRFSLLFKYFLITNNFFKNTGIELAHTQISFDLFSFSFGQKQLYKNLRTFSDISAHSSGNLYYYPEFNSRSHGLKFSNELYHNLSRKNAWEAVFRIRLS